jgi:hypothetical protein
MLLASRPTSEAFKRSFELIRFPEGVFINAREPARRPIGRELGYDRLSCGRGDPKTAVIPAYPDGFLTGERLCILNALPNAEERCGAMGGSLWIIHT